MRTPGQLYASGLGLRKVAQRWSADHFPVSHETVRLWVVAEGVPLRACPPSLRPGDRVVALARRST